MSTSFFKRFGKALANKGNAQYYDDSKVRLIGFWRSEEDEAKPDPGQFVDPGWDESEKQEVIEFLKKGEIVAAYRGYSWCRFSCKNNQNGTSDLSDGYYRWPEGLVHYVETHHIKLPDEFIQHVKSSKGHSLERLRRIKSHQHPEDNELEWWSSQKGNNLPVVRTFGSQYAKRTPENEGYPYLVQCSGPNLYKRSDGRYQIIEMHPLSHKIKCDQDILVEETLLEVLKQAYPAIKFNSAPIFRKATGEEWNEYYCIDQSSVPLADSVAFSEPANHSGISIWHNDEYGLFLTSDLKDSLQAAGFKDLTFSHNYLL